MHRSTVHPIQSGVCVRSSMLLLVMAVCWLPVVPVANADELRTVVLSSDVAPGTSGGVSFLGFNTYTVNNSASVLFRAGLTGAGVDASNDGGLWSEGGGGLALLAREGDVPPGVGAGVFFEGFQNQPSFNNAGQTAFQAELSGPNVFSNSDFGIWSQGGGGGLAMVARENGAAPGTAAGVTFDRFTSSPVLNDSGHIAFRAALTGTGVLPGNDHGLWSANGATASLLVREGDAAPGTTADFAVFNQPVINGLGQLAFAGSLTGTGVDSFNNEGVWSNGGGAGLTLVARKGGAAPGTGNFFQALNTNDRVVINDLGQTAFIGGLSGTGSSGNDSGIWAESGSGLRLVAREGDAAPEAGAGVLLSIFSDVVINGQGAIAFEARLVGAGVGTTNERGLWSEGGGAGLQLVARRGDQAPDAPVGTNFNVFKDHVLNGAGKLAFSASLSTGGDGIWAEGLDGVLRGVALPGDILEVAAGDFRTISSVGAWPAGSSTGNQDGHPSAFNDSGHLVFKATFTDGTSGIFVSNTAAVPEPVGATLVVLGLACLLFSRTWQRSRACRLQPSVLAR